ncbi:putative molibdopterin-dependent oxidoreductase YjgC [Bradyrhizobium sp. GM5.1]
MNHPVAATFIKNAVKQYGAKLFVMDPRRQTLSRHATKHLQFKPGSDVAMLNAMIHTIITEGLTDDQYIAGYTEGFEELKEKIKEFTPEKMEPICGVPAQTLREVARTYARAKSSIIFWGMGISQHVHGTDNARCLIALALITGQVGRPGTGLHPLRGQNNVQGASDAGLIPMFLPDYQPVGRDDMRGAFEKLWGQDLDPVRGLTVVEIMNAIHAGEIKGMYIEGENPAMSDPDLQHARQALAMLDHLVVQDLFVTETAFHADVILPASAFAEKEGSFTNTDRRVQLARQVIKPPGDARQDLWIIQEIGKRMGLPWNYAGPGEVFTEMAELMSVAEEHHLGAAGARRRGDLSRRRSRRARQRDHLHHGLPDRQRPRQDRSGSRHPAGRDPRHRISDGALDRPRARALAHRLDDPPRAGA